MRLLPTQQQDAILSDLRTDIPKLYSFHFTTSHVEIITGKQEGKKQNKNDFNRQYALQRHFTTKYTSIVCRFSFIFKFLLPVEISKIKESQQTILVVYRYSPLSCKLPTSISLL